jgi:RNA polymerase sigma-70 factor (ECF subfamily)
MTTATPQSTARTDQELLEQAAHGDERGLAELYDRYAPPLYSLALRVTGLQADAEEVVLDAFSQAWREAGRFSADRGSVGAWLTMICRSRALDLIRSRGRRGKALDRARGATPDGTPGMGSPTADPSRAAELSEQADQVNQALEGLSPPQREAISLAFYEGLSHSEIAERLSEPLGTVKTRVRLGMQKLRDALRPYYAEASS